MENVEENRRFYRELLFTAPGLSDAISGVIMFEETLGQSTADGRKFVDVLKAQGIITGIKVDKGTLPVEPCSPETVTVGLDDLGKRCAAFYAAGARFAKWRGVIYMGSAGYPTPHGLEMNCRNLAAYARVCQDNGLVPIVEPEVLMDGDHTVDRAAAVTQEVLSMQYRCLAEYGVVLEGTLLKPNMVRMGETSTEAPNADKIALATVRTLQRTMPAAVPGVVFLSGGMSEVGATEALNKINLVEGKKPWVLTFSYGRALQQSCLAAWGGKPENKAAAQAVLMVRARANGAAALGQYKPPAGGEDAAATASLHVKNYVY